jgi:hypothetical protein
MVAAALGGEVVTLVMSHPKVICRPILVTVDLTNVILHMLGRDTTSGDIGSVLLLEPQT